MIAFGIIEKTILSVFQKESFFREVLEFFKNNSCLDSIAAAEAGAMGRSGSNCM